MNVKESYKKDAVMDITRRKLELAQIITREVYNGSDKTQQILEEYEKLCKTQAELEK